MKTIKSKRDFERVFSRGRRFNDQLLRIRVAASDEGAPSGVAFVAAKRLGNAVFRNRCKRVLREAARACDFPVPGYDVILFATAATRDAAPQDLCAALMRLSARAGVGR